MGFFRFVGYEAHHYMSGGDGRESTNTATAISTIACRPRIRGGTCSTTDTTSTAIIESAATNLVRPSIEPSRRQFRIIWPNTRCSSNQSWNRVEDRAKANAANSTNGVVGSKGKTTPRTPSNKAVAPTVNQTRRNKLFALTSRALIKSSSNFDYSTPG